MTKAADLSALGSNVTTSGNLSSASTLTLQTNSTTAVTVDASQNVGIGTTSPTQKLQVYSSGASGGAIQITNASTGAISTDGLLLGYDGSNDVIINNQEATATKFYTSGTERMRIDSSGNVTVGTTATTYNYQTKNIALYDGASSGISVASGSKILTLTSQASGGCFVGTRSNDDLRFTTNDIERMRIGSDGFVRVNNTGGLDGQFSSLAGAFYAAAFANTDATITTVYSWNKATSGNNLLYQFYTDTGTLRGSIDYNRAGNAVRYTTTSDQRLKENIVDAPSATSLINSIKIRSFDWKETGFHVDYGVIAQELNEVAPDAVSEGIDNEDGTIKQSWGVDTSVLVPALIKSIQEQQTIINDLKADIVELKEKVGK
jgi:hypothetical protein